MAVALKDDRGEDLDPVHHKRPVARPADLARQGIATHPLRALARNERRLSVRRAGADRLQRACDSARDELILAGRVGTLMTADRPLAQIARAGPRLLARQQLREAVRAIAVGGDALVALPTMARLAVVAVKPHSRACVLGPGTGERR